MCDTVFVQGFEFTVDEALSLHPEVVWILGHIARFGAAVIELDDGLDSFKIKEQLEKMGGEYFDVLSKNQTLYCINSDRFEIRGPSVYCDD